MKFLGILASFFLCILWSSSANAAFGIDVLIGRAAEATIAGAVKFGFSQNYRPVYNPKLAAKAELARDIVHQFAKHNFRYNKIDIKVIVGDPDEPNAFSIGPVIYITQDFVEKLSLRELTAVVAHEMAHSEQGHFAKRIPFPIGAAFLHLGKLLISDAIFLANGSSDAYMQDILKDGQWESIKNLLQGGILGQELEADCIASQWLYQMHKDGRANYPLDLNTATEKVMGINLSSEDPQSALYIRASAIINRMCY